jgi:GNAT superfamily N-acetyltransferase
MQTIELVAPEARDIPELGRICFEAFRSIHDRHAFPRDFPDVETAIKVLGLLSGLRQVCGVAARSDGRLIGSNFVLLTDAVGGVGPITIDPEWQGRGAGRRLMQAVIDHAASRGVERVRLLQDSFNTASLSLYASVGFDVRETIGVMRPPPVSDPDPTVRLAGAAELGAVDQLCERLYRVPRGGEIREWCRNGIPILVREIDGRIRGYALPGMLGHGVSETEVDALALIRQLSGYAPPGMEVFFLPLRQTSLYRAALRAGARLIKVMTLMSLGPYEEPGPFWMPSILY